MTEENITIQDLLGMGPMADIKDPYRIYTEIRAENPILDITQYGSNPDDEKKSFLLTGYDEIKKVLKDDTNFSNKIVQDTMGIVMGPTIIGMDGKEHLKHRTLVTPSLSPKALRGDFSTYISKIAHELIDKFAENGEGDLHHDFSFSFPLTVFVSLLGLPVEDVDKVHHWGVDLCLVASDPGKGLEASAALEEYLTPIVKAKREDPSDDIISVLIKAVVQDNQLTDYEIVSFLRLLVLAGAETTNHLIGSAMYALLNDSDLMERVRNDRKLVPVLLQETMRWESPISTVMRETAQDVTLGGVLMPKGATLICQVGAANRDERKFKDPDTFNIDRDDNDHIAFGYGKHFCAGSHLAKFEGEIAVNALLDRLDNIKLKPDPSTGVIGFSFRGPNHLPVTFSSTNKQDDADRNVQPRTYGQAIT